MAENYAYLFTIILLRFLSCADLVTTHDHKVVKRQSEPVVCGQPLYTGSVSETAQPGTFILRASATDTSGATLTWSIPDTSLQRFSINPSTGDISVTRVLDRSFFRSALEFRIRATETTDPTSYCEAVVRINVLPVTATSATTSGIFAQSTYSFTVSTCAIGTSIGQVVASSTSGQTFTYSTPSGSSYFSVNPTTGLITLLQIPPTGTQSFSVTATSSSGTTGTVPVTVTTSCSSTGIGTGGITFSQPSYTFTQTTCTPGGYLGQVIAFSTTGGLVTYTLLSSNGLYTINPTTGLITSLSTSSLGTQTLQVQAISSTGQSAIVPVTVTSICSGIGSTFPFTTGTGTVSFSQPYYTVTATSCVPGGTIGQVAAISNGLPVTYQVVPVSPYFSVNPTTGLITVIQAPPAGVPTTLQVQALASTGQSAIATVSIIGCSGTTGTYPYTTYPYTSGTTYPYSSYPSSSYPYSTGIGGIGSTPPTFLQPVYQLTASSCTSGAVVGSITAQSPYGIPIYSIDGGNPYFAINPQTGSVTVLTQPPANYPQTLTVRATANGYSSSVPVTIIASCTGATGTTGTGGLSFTQSTYTFSAGSCTSGSQVGQIQATSPTGGTVTYSFSTSNGQYLINPSTGAITAVTQLTPGQSTTMTVLATASTGQSGSATVTITPSCGQTTFGGTPGITQPVTTGTLSFSQPSYSFTLSSCTSGSVLGSVSATPSTGGTVTYTSTGSSYFGISPTTGSIGVLSIPPAGTYTLNINAQSSTGQSGATTATITVSCGSGSGSGSIGISGPVIVNPSRPAPQFNQSSYQCSVSCNSITQRVCVVQASNIYQDTMNYQITPTTLFYIDSNSGEIRTILPLRTGSTYPVSASATDPYGNTASAPVTITVVGTC